MKTHLLLASDSVSRKKLLEKAKIPFKTTGHDADETACDWGVPFPQILQNIAVHKMNHVILPEGQEGGVLYVLTADTMNQDTAGNIHGKPRDKADAMAKIKALKEGRVGTAFCLDKKKYLDGSWCVGERVLQCVLADYYFDMPEAFIIRYLDSFERYDQVSGGISVEGYGTQFLKSVDGSYSAILGLPMYELRLALEQVGFYNDLIKEGHAF